MRSAHTHTVRYARTFTLALISVALAMVCAAPAYALNEDDPWAIAPAVQLTPLGGMSSIPTSLTERGAAATMRLNFSTRPTAPVDVRFISDGQVAADLPVRTVLSEQWSAGVTVRVSAIIDGLLEGPHHGTLRIKTESRDPLYDGLTVAPLQFDLVDADRAGVEFTPDPIELAEGDAATQLGVRLTAAPAANVQVLLRADPAQFTLSRVTLTFTPGNWNVAQYVAAQAIDDDVHEAPSTRTYITTSTSSTSAVFHQVDVPPTKVQVYDDDAASVDVDAPEIIQLDEARASSGTDIAVRLTSKPSSAVTISAADSSGQVRLSAKQRVFTPSNWSEVQRISVTPVDDQLVESRPHTASIALHATSNDPDYQALRIASRTVQIQDDDAVGLELVGVRNWPTAAVTPVRPMTGAARLSESGTPARVRMNLASAPTRELTIRPVIAPLGQLRVTPASITVRAGASLPSGAEFDVSAVDDDTDEVDTHAASITWELLTSDSDYAGLSTIVTPVDITDDDSVGVRVTPSERFDTVEGGPQRDVQIMLTSAPVAPVVISMLADAQVTAVGKTSGLRFDHQTWNVPQTVAIAARDDDASELSPHAGLVAFDVASTDPKYNDLAVAAIDVAIRDNDAPGVLVSATGADTKVVEGGAGDIVNVRLRSRPIAPVTVRLTDATGLVRLPLGGEVTIEPNAWKHEHPVEVAAAQDDVLHGVRTVPLAATLTSTDPLYAAGVGVLPRPLDVIVVDDEQPGVVIAQSGGDTAVTEAGAADTYTVALAAKPTSDVTVAFQPDGQVKTAPSAVTFSPATWKTPQEVTVSAVQDDVDEPETHTGSIRHVVQTSAAGWAGALKVPDLGVRVLDDDTASIRFDATGGSTRVVEGGATDIVTMLLTSRPAATVEITAKPDAQVAVSAPLVFTPDDWRQPRTLTITAVDDQAVTGQLRSSVGFVVTSSDLNYKNQRIPPLDVIVVDNDVWKDDEESSEDGDSHTTTVEANDVPAPPVPAANPDADTRSGAADDHGGANAESGSSAPPADPASTAVTAPAADALVAGMGDDGSGSAAPAARASELASVRQRTGDSKEPSADKPSTIGKWARKNIGLLAITGGLLGLTGIGGGWLALRNPTRMARR